MSHSVTDIKQALHDVPQASRPKHIAVIMDGNGRWAQTRGLPRIEGHRKGVGAVRRTVESCVALEVQQLTLYCLSSENWKRPEQELSFLMRLLQQYLIEERGEIMRQGVRLQVIGRREGIPPEVQKEMDRSIEMSAGNSGLCLALAINYGGRGEIVDAVRAIVRETQAGTLDPEAIDEQCLSRHLYTCDMPDPDLLIRTAGEMRVSNFLLWQLSYSEIWVTKDYWPEFGPEHLILAIRDYWRRERRFGGLASPREQESENQGEKG